MTSQKVQEVEDDEAESASDGDDNGSDDEGSTSFVTIRDKQYNVVQTKCCIISECTGKACNAGPSLQDDQRHSTRIH